MHVELGNAQPHEINRPDQPLPGPAVTTITIPDDLTLDAGADVQQLAAHLAQNPTVTRLPRYEMFVQIVHGQAGVWRPGVHGAGHPTWVHCESDTDPAKAAELERLLSEFWSCLRGRPHNLEETHHTASGPPGVGPTEPVVPEPEMEGTLPPELDVNAQSSFGPDGEVQQ